MEKDFEVCPSAGFKKGAAAQRKDAFYNQHVGDIVTVAAYLFPAVCVRLKDRSESRVNPKEAVKTVVAGS